MALNSDKVIKSLLKKGFDKINKDHKFFIFKNEGREVLHTKVSHGKKDLSKYLISLMSKQCKLSKEDFIDLVNCPLSKAQYIEKLRQKEMLD